jgi:hypothetical protein
VDDYLAAELANGKLLPAPPSTHVHTSPIGLIPKKGRIGKYRLIVDLSSPEGHSVNDGIDPNLCSFKYISVRDVSPWVRGGAFMAKLDLRSAYRMVPVHSSDQHLLGVRWGSASYCDAALPFGLRSAPIIFNSIADALAWAMKCRGIENVVHYLDDFLFWSNEAPQSLPG